MNETEKDTSNIYGNYQHTTASKINENEMQKKKVEKSLLCWVTGCFHLDLDFIQKST